MLPGQRRLAPLSLQAAVRKAPVFRVECAPWRSLGFVFSVDTRDPVIVRMVLANDDAGKG